MTGPSILLYHRVAADPADGQMLAVSPERFAQQLAWLQTNRRVIPLSQLAEDVSCGRLERDVVSITFDDGYADNLNYALPILERYGMPATIFVTAGRVGTTKAFWWDMLDRLLLTDEPLPPLLTLPASFGHLAWAVATPKGRLAAYDHLSVLLKTLPPAGIDQAIGELQAWASAADLRLTDRMPLTVSELCRLADSKLIEIGAHTMEHPRLTVLSAAEQRAEIEASKTALEAWLKRPVTLFSYPFGAAVDFSAATESLAREAGFAAACSNIQQAVTVSARMYALPRLLVRNWTGTQFGEWVAAAYAPEAEREALELRTAQQLERLGPPGAAGEGLPAVRIVTAEAARSLDADSVEEPFVYVAHPDYRPEAGALETMAAAGVAADALCCGLKLRRRDGSPFYRPVDTVSLNETYELVGGKRPFLYTTLFQTAYFARHREAILQGDPLSEDTRLRYFPAAGVSASVADHLRHVMPGEAEYFIYGAGAHTSDLLAQLGEAAGRVKGIFDRNAALAGTLIAGVPVMASERLGEADPLPILISSTSYEAEITRELSRVIPMNRVRRIYLASQPDNV